VVFAVIECEFKNMSNAHNISFIAAHQPLEILMNTTTTPTQATQRADQRLGRRYCFADPDMDLFFMSALSFGPTGGLDIGQAFHVASTIVDGDADSWVASFAAYGQAQEVLADTWKARGCRRSAGEARLKAFASYRSAWQFAGASETFGKLYARHKQAFAAALDELGLPATFFAVPYAGKQLPGVYFQNANRQAPVVLVIGGADTCFEDLFLGVGRNLLDRGYSVAIADLPGQGITQAEGLHWEVEAEKPIAAVIDQLIARFGARPGRIALFGLSLGGYFVTRAAGHETRLATVIATTPFPNPGELFRLAVEEATAEALREGAVPPTQAAQRSREVSMWKAGARTPQEFVARSADMRADPKRVTVPFLSIIGAGDSPVFVRQAQQWHREIRSERKACVLLDAASGADGHCQVNNRLRLAQECCAWLDEIFAA
jgi:pimeloyl-ACP methyl ester carboxylesterase